MGIGTDEGTSELYRSESLRDEDGQNSQASGGDWGLRTAGCDGIILVVYQGKVGDRFHPSPLLRPGPLGGMWQ